MNRKPSSVTLWIYSDSMEHIQEAQIRLEGFVISKYTKAVVDDTLLQELKANEVKITKIYHHIVQGQGN